MNCDICKKDDEELQTQKCPICFKRFCDECSAGMSGRRFCSRFCAEYFFFGGDEDL